MKNPNTNIHRRYVVLLSSECQSGAQPSPESSGTYLPHPKSGGIERANAYNQIMHMIFTQALIPTVRPNCKKLPYLQTDNVHKVSIDTNPDVVTNAPLNIQAYFPNAHPFCTNARTSNVTPTQARINSAEIRLSITMLYGVRIVEFIEKSLITNPFNRTPFMPMDVSNTHIKV